MTQDASAAVRSQAIECLRALLNTNAETAIQWFVSSVELDPILLKTRIVHQFLYDGSYRDSEPLRPVLQKMLESDKDQQIKTAAEIVCRTALVQEIWKRDADLVKRGPPAMRKAAATIYGTNVAHAEVGALCCELLLPFLEDQDESVQREAANAFRHFTRLESADQRMLLSAFLASKPKLEALGPIIFALKDSPSPFPDIVCRVVEAGVIAYEKEGGGVLSHSANLANELSRIALSLYSQSDDEEIRRRCLDSIDAMERGYFYGLSEKLDEYER